MGLHAAIGEMGDLAKGHGEVVWYDSARGVYD